jgi:hypothetical protein
LQKRYGSLLETGETVQHLHSAEYTVVYDNNFEHLEARAYDTTDDPAKMDPIVRWAHKVLLLADQTPEK